MRFLVLFVYNALLLRDKIKEIIMDLKFARTEVDAKPKKVDLAKLEASVEKEDSVIFYFDRENSHKDLLELQDYFEAKGKSFYMSEVKYGLSDNEYMYQVHIIN
jgi:hypothetical protein